MNWKETKWKELEQLADNLINYYNFTNKIKFYIAGDNCYGFESICKALDIEYEFINIGNTGPVLTAFSRKDGIIIVDTPRQMRISKTFEKILEPLGLEKNLHYFIVDNEDLLNFMSEIFPIIYAKIYNRWYVPQVQVTLTTRCTLKCKDCGNGCNHWDKTDKSNDLTFEDTKAAIDALFNKAHFVDRINMLGGETLLCQDVLKQIYKYIKKQYLKRYRRLGLFTNGTIIPSHELLQTLKDCNVTLFISDYSTASFDAGKRIGELLYNLRKYKIDFFVFHEKLRWFDYQLYETEHSQEEGDKIRKICITQYPYLRCPEVINDMLYVCSMAYVTLKSKKIDIKKENGLKLSNVTNVLYAVKYFRGLAEDIKSCQYCNGIEGNKLLCGVQEDEL